MSSEGRRARGAHSKRYCRFGWRREALRACISARRATSRTLNHGPRAHTNSASMWRRLTWVLKAVFFIEVRCASHTMVPSRELTVRAGGRGYRRLGAARRRRVGGPTPFPRTDSSWRRHCMRADAWWLGRRSGTGGWPSNGTGGGLPPAPGTTRPVRSVQAARTHAATA